MKIIAKIIFVFALSLPFGVQLYTTSLGSKLNYKAWDVQAGGPITDVVGIFGDISC